MSKTPTDAAAKAEISEPTPSAESVAEFLIANPDFLLARPALLGALTPPEWQTGEAVVDFQHFMVEKLRSQVRSLGAREQTLIAAAEANAVTLTRIHRATLALLDAATLGNFIRCINRDLPALLNIDVATFCIEASDELAQSGADGIVLLTQGSVDRLLPDDADFVLRKTTIDDAAVLTPSGKRIGSIALLRIRLGPMMPPSMLALGAADADEFHDGQATDLLGYFAGVIERSLARWMDQLP